MAWLGIDPGLSGAVALIQPDGSVRFWDTPSLDVSSPSAHKTNAGNVPTRTAYDYPGMVAVIESARIVAPLEGVVLELVNAMPKQGVASVFKFGDGFGAWKGILAALRVPYDLVHPRRWSNALLKDLPQGDNAPYLRATQLYPAVVGELRTARGRLLDGRVDALLLAHYARLRREPGI